MVTPLYHSKERQTTRMLKGRKPVYSTLDDFVWNVERADAKNQTVILTEALLPSDFYSGQNWLKRGERVHLQLEHSVDAIMKCAHRGEMIGPTRTRNEQFRNLGEGPYVGYDWSTLDRRKRHHVLLTFCIEGSRLWNRVEKEFPKSIKVHGYHSRIESPRYGWTFDVEVPSFSGGDPYVFKMENVAVDRVPEQHLVWRNMKSDGHIGGRKRGRRHQGCEFKYYGELTHGRPKTYVACVHEVVAHRAISSWAKNKKGIVILQPYALPSQKTVDFYVNLCRHTLVQEKVKNIHGLERLRRRPMFIPEMEKVLWDYVRLRSHGDNNPFYAKGLLRSYRWD
jgi:hypothetical protein